MMTDPIVNRKTGQNVSWSEVAKDTDVVDNLARICHEANRAFCETLGDKSQPTWETAPDWQKTSAKMGVTFHLSDTRTPSDSHQAWWSQKKAEGWKWGETKNPDTKEHPCMVPYNELPLEQRFKDYLFHGIVNSYKEYVQKEG